MKGKVRDACHGQGRMAGRWMEENRVFFPVAAADYIFYYQLYFYVFAAADYEHCTFFIQIFFLLLLIVSDF